MRCCYFNEGQRNSILITLKLFYRGFALGLVDWVKIRLANMTAPIGLMDLDTLVSHVSARSLLALPSNVSTEFSGVSMVGTRALIRKNVKGLHLVAVPSTGLQSDLL
ncbi:uncharacterized protein METZ01_LOCUS497209, partial [marine metagenome]